MGRYNEDQNKVVLLYESGLYANTSGNGVWVGEVTNNDIDDQEGKLENRYLGTGTRSVDSIEQGPRDVTGVLTYNVQNMRLPFLAIGSTVSTSGTNSFHVTTEINSDVRQNAFTSGTLNPPMSFTIEDSKQAPGTGRNFIRTVVGCVPNTVTINASQGEKNTVEVDWIGQTLTPSSGATTSVTQDTNTPYLWSSNILTVAGSVIQTAKDMSLEINQNITGPHYLNGSRDISTPYAGNRMYGLNVTIDLDSNEAMMLYNIYKNNGSFNATWDMNQDSTAGSQHTVLNMNNCVIMNMANPSTNDGLTETTIEIQPVSVGGSEWTSTAGANNFNPW